VTSEGEIPAGSTHTHLHTVTEICPCMAVSASSHAISLPHNGRVYLYYCANSVITVIIHCELCHHLLKPV